MADQAPVLAVRDLKKTYRKPPVLANDGISFDLAGGRTFGLLGPNGAGKTTLVKQIVGLLTPDSGTILLHGEALRPGSRRGSGTIAYLPQGTMALGDLKVEEAVNFTGRLRGLRPAQARADTEELLDVLAMGPIASRPVRKVSGGQRRLVQLAMTLAGKLAVLIFDEPTTDVDPALRATVWRLLEERARAGAAVLLVTHDVSEAEHVLDEVAILSKGRVVAAGTPADLKADLAHKIRIELVLAEGVDTGPRPLGADLGEHLVVRGRSLSAWVPAEDAVHLLEKTVAAIGMENLEDIRLVSPSLEDVYMATRAGEEEAG